VSTAPGSRDLPFIKSSGSGGPGSARGIKSPLPNVAGSPSFQASTQVREALENPALEGNSETTPHWSKPAMGRIPQKREFAKGKGVYNPRRLLRQGLTEQVILDAVAHAADAEDPRGLGPSPPRSQDDAASQKSAVVPSTPQVGSAKGKSSRQVRLLT
jgi:hypothetical protein